MFVKSGLVKVYKESKDGRSYILKIVTPGEFLGLLSFYGNTIHQFSASAVEDCEIGYIDIQIFNQVLKKKRDLCHGIDPACEQGRPVYV